MKPGRRIWGLACGVAAALAMLAGGQARAQSAVLVEAGNVQLRDDLQWLADRGVIHLSTWAWPLPLSVIDSALAARGTTLAPGDRDALLRVEVELARLRAPFRAGEALRVNTASVPTFGFDQPVRGKADASAWVQASQGALAGKLQVHGLVNPFTDRQSHVNLEGSYLAGQWGGQVFYAGQLPHWWGPGQDGSLIWSNAALALPGFGMKRGSEKAFESRWLSWIGPWSYEVFFGRMLHNELVPGVRIFSLRVQAQPLPGFEIAASRLIQWGGAGNSHGVRQLFNAIRGRSNSLTDVNNEIAGFDARYTLLAAGNPLTIYGQFIGEDEAGLRPTDYLSLAGLQYKQTLYRSRVQWTLETADTMSARLFGLRRGAPNIAYTHFQFLDGMYHEGLPIGHFIGGDGRSNSIGVSVTPIGDPYRASYAFRFVHAQVNPSNQTENLAFPVSDSVRMGEVTGSWQVRVKGITGMKLKLGLNAADGRVRGRDLGANIGVELPL